MAHRQEVTLPPHNSDAEQAVLGACLADRDVILQLINLLKPDHFFRRPHRLIYGAICALYEARVPADLIAVVDYLSRTGDIEDAGSEPYIAELIAATPTAVHARYYAEIVVGYALRRRAISAGTEIVKLGYDTTLPPLDLMSRVEEAVRDAASEFSLMGEQVLSMTTIVNTYWDALDADVETDPPVPWGIPGLDRITSGMRPSQLIMIGARTSVGKSALALTAAYNAAREGFTVGIISLEMTEQEILERWVAIRTGLSTTDVRGFMRLSPAEQTQVSEALAYLAELRLFVSADRSDYFEDAVTMARSMHEREHIDLLVIDYAQLLKMRKRTSNRVEELEEITRGMKRLARELDIPVLTMAQLNRGSEDRRAPVLSDFRGSGSFEQDANVAILLHEVEDRETEHSASVIANVAKNRNGPNSQVPLRRITITTEMVEEA